MKSLKEWHRMKNTAKISWEEILCGSCQVGVQHLYGAFPDIFCLEICSIYLRK